METESSKGYPESSPYLPLALRVIDFEVHERDWMSRINISSANLAGRVEQRE